MTEFYINRLGHFIKKGIALESLPALDGLRNIFNVTDVLDKYKRTITIHYDGGDYITLSCVIVCYRIYLQIDEQSTKLVTYSGTEHVEDDQGVLLSLLSDLAQVSQAQQHASGPADVSSDNTDTILRDVGDLIRFLRFLHKREHFFFIGHSRSDTIMVTIVLQAYLIELDFFDDHIEYSLFQKDDASETDRQRMLDLLAWFSRDDDKINTR